METEGNVGKYPEGLRELVVSAARAEGVWEAVERYGVPYSTVKYWCARARMLAEGGGSAGEVGKGPGEGAGIGAGAPAPMPAAPIPVDALGAAEAADTVTVGDAAAMLGDGDGDGDGEGDGGQPTRAAEARRTWRVHSWEEVLAAVQDWEKLGTAGTAKKHSVSEQTVRNWRQQVRDVLAGRGQGPSPAVETDVYLPEAADANVPAGAVAADAGADEAEAEDEADDGICQPTAVDPAEWERLKARREAVGKRYTPTQKAEAVALATTEGPAAEAREIGASPHSIYRWQGEVKREAGEPVERRWELTEVEKQRDLEILHEWHKQPGLGPSQIRNQLRRRGIRTSVQTVRRVMVEGGYRPPKVKSQAHHERYEAVRPSAIWHFDSLHRHIHRAPTFTLILLDDYSRFVVGHAVDDAERADTVIETFEAAVARHGKPEAVMTDRGSAFWAWRGISRFTALLEDYGIDHYVAREKEVNGKIEKFNADLAKEFFDVKEYADVAEMRQELSRHVRWHNHERTHHSLGGILVPADRFYGRVDEVMRLVESGAMKTGADPHGISLAGRALDLFRIVSTDGQPQVWLLGQRIL